MSPDERTAKMVTQIARAARTDINAWREAGEPEQIALPVSLELRARLVEEDAATAETAYFKLLELLEAVFDCRRVDEVPS